LLTNYIISLSGSLLPIHCSVDIENPSDVKKTVFSAVRVILSFFGFNTIGTIDSDCVVQKPYGRIANKPNEDEKI